MTLTLALLWTSLLALCAVSGAFYARLTGRSDGLMALFVALVLVSNIVAAKILAFDFGVITFFAPGAALIFSVTFLITDIVNERFGKKETLRMILLAFAAQVAFNVFAYLALIAPGAPFFTNQEAFETVLGVAPRIALAGLITFLITETLDAHLFHWFRRLTKGRHLWARNAFSSLPAMAVDSTVFVLLAFWGTMPVIPLILGLTAAKWLVGVVDIPFMYLSRWVMNIERTELV